MATPKIIADFETQLATALAVGGTSFTLSSATDDDGVALPSGLYYFTVENGTSNKEYLAGTLSGTSVTSVVSVSRQGAETSGAVRAHRIGSSVIITDFATYKKYMDEIALVSAPDASTTVKGVVEAATLAEVRARTGTGGTGAVLAVTPDVMDDLPTSDEKAALAGAGATPSASNAFLTEGDVDDNTLFPPPQVVTFTSSGTWTKDAGLKYIVVEVQAGGAGGNANQGGGGGGYSRKLILASALGATETVTVGAAGTGSATTPTAGGNSSFGTHATANGGATAGTGGTAASGDINIQGGTGNKYVNGDNSHSFGLPGGDSQFGRGGAGGIYQSAGGSATGYGAGGGAGGDSGYSGGNGTAGIVIVTEYYS